MDLKRGGAERQQRQSGDAGHAEEMGDDRCHVCVGKMYE